jgi:hypothetical protein
VGEIRTGEFKVYLSKETWHKSWPRYLVGVDSNGDAEGAGESEVGNFDATRLVDEQILWLQIPVAKQKDFAVQIFSN